VILNKIDLVKDDLEDLERRIHDVNALVTVVRSVRCQVDLNTIFDRQAYGVKVIKLVKFDFLTTWCFIIVTILCTQQGFCDVNTSIIYVSPTYFVFRRQNSSQLQELLEYSKSVPPNSRHDNSISTLCISEQDPVHLAKVRAVLG
jgi:G3E family GTPase